MFRTDSDDSHGRERGDELPDDVRLISAVIPVRGAIEDGTLDPDGKKLDYAVDLLLADAGITPL